MQSSISYLCFHLVFFFASKNLLQHRSKTKAAFSHSNKIHLLLVMAITMYHHPSLRLRCTTKATLNQQTDLPPVVASMRSCRINTFALIKYVVDCQTKKNTTQKYISFLRRKSPYFNWDDQ